MVSVVRPVKWLRSGQVRHGIGQGQLGNAPQVIGHQGLPGRHAQLLPDRRVDGRVVEGHRLHHAADGIAVLYRLADHLILVTATAMTMVSPPGRVTGPV